MVPRVRIPMSSNIDYYERLHKLGIVHQHGAEFLTFQLQGDAK